MSKHKLSIDNYWVEIGHFLTNVGIYFEKNSDSFWGFAITLYSSNKITNEIKNKIGAARTRELMVVYHHVYKVPNFNLLGKLFDDLI